MITFKQIEALIGIVQMGSFERAADRLSTTQSAVSKRIRELELECGFPVFDRSHRDARLTPKGEQLFELGQEMLMLQDRAAQLRHGEKIARRRLRLGATELTALTWLPSLILRLRTEYPFTTIEPVIDLSRNLYERLYDDVIDIVIIPAAFSSPEITSHKLGEISHAWMASPFLNPRLSHVSFDLLKNYTFLTQGKRSGASILTAKWMKTLGIELPETLICESLIAQLGLTVAGLGVSCLPNECLAPLVEAGKLQILTGLEVPPNIPYAAMYRNDQPTAFTAEISELAASVCDFSRQFAMPALTLNMH